MEKAAEKISGFEDFGINKLQEQKRPRALSFSALIVLVSSLAAKYSCQVTVSQDGMFSALLH